jgi:hypothetical protein
MGMELRATLKTVRGKAGRGESPAPSYEVVMIVAQTGAAAELLPFIGHDLAVSLEPMERMLYNRSMSGRTPLEEAVEAGEQEMSNGTAPAAGSNGEEAEQEAPARRRRRPAAAQTGP